MVNRRAYTANSFHGASEQHFKRLSVFYEIWIMIVGLNSALPRILASFPTLSSNLNNLSQANYQGKFIYRWELKNCPHQKCHFEVHTTLLTIIEMTVLPRSLHRPWRPPRKMNFTLQIWCIKCRFWILKSVYGTMCARGHWVAFVRNLHTPSLSFSLSLSIYLFYCIPHTFPIRPLAFKGVHGVCH